jgi:integration host factor subunit alpha
MAGKTITRADLAEAVYRKVGLSRTESAELVEMVLDEMVKSVERGDKNERIGRNPKTGEEVPITPRRVISFKASNVLKHRIQTGHQMRKGG